MHGTDLTSMVATVLRTLIVQYDQACFLIQWHSVLRWQQFWAQMCINDFLLFFGMNSI